MRKLIRNIKIIGFIFQDLLRWFFGIFICHPYGGNPPPPKKK